jgi:hypothetical protein
LSVIISLQNFWRGRSLACVGSYGIRIEWNEGRCMIALGLVRVIERHSDELAAELIAKLETSSRTSPNHLSIAVS